MSHTNIGILLEQLNIRSPKEFFTLGEQERYALLSLIQSSAGQNAKQSLDSIQRDVGLKMHFRVRRKSRGGGWQNIPNETFMRKVGFFASNTIITYPFNDFNPRKEEDIQPLLSMICAARPFLKEGMVSIIPSSETSGVSFEKKFNKKYGLVSANFALEELETQFEEKVYPTNIGNIYLPYFNPLEPEEVIQLRQDEKYLYEGLEHRLGVMFRGLEQLDTEEKLFRELQVISQQVRILTEKYKALQEAYSRRDITTIVGFAVAKLIALFLSPGIPAIAASTSAIQDIKSLSDFCQYKIEKALKEKEARVEGYYLFWQLDKCCWSKKTEGRRVL